MQHYVSPSVQGFFVDTVHGDSMPADAAPLTEEGYAEAVERSHAGYVVKSVKDGRGVFALAPRPSGPDVVRAQANLLIQDVDVVALGFFKQGLPFPPEWVAYHDALQGIAALGKVPKAGWPTAPSTAP
jgi:hypothetical protein